MNPLSTLCLRGPCILDPVVDAFACTVFARRAQVCETYVAAAGVCVVDPWLAKEKAKAKKDMLRSHTEKAVGSTEAMGIIFSHLDDIWDRLSTLAYFWNTASRDERHKILAVGGRARARGGAQLAERRQR